MDKWRVSFVVCDPDGDSGSVQVGVELDTFLTLTECLAQTGLGRCPAGLPSVTATTLSPVTQDVNIFTSFHIF